MSLIHEQQIKEDTVIQVCRLMAVAARTAPKARGNDNLEIAILQGETIVQLSNKMEEISTAMQMPFFSRDAANLLLSQAVLLIGVKINTTGLNFCGYCGMETCENKQKFGNVPCAFNLIDLGIAAGSAATDTAEPVAAAHHIDNRVMFSAGKAALELGLMSENIRDIVAIPLSVQGKSPFFDRK
ncbi:MAG TPA: DUF2148 domain-containing protein [Bacteroidales bacterium]|nr:DUF2148 domain-containing protein [Bacteroidales bacterium]